MPQVLAHYLTEAGCRDRTAALCDRLLAEADAVILTTPMHITYLTDLQFSPIGNSAHALAILVIDADGNRTLLADNHLLKRQPEPFVERLVPVRYYSGQDAMVERRAAVLEALVRTVGDRCRGRVLAVEERCVPQALVAHLQPARLVDAFEPLRQLRRHKYADELALIERSARAIEAGLDWAVRHVRPGMSEADVYRGVWCACAASVGEPVVVYGDFASGPRTWEDRGGPPTERVIQRGDLLILDFSVLVGGYRADFTNTLCVGAEPSRMQRELMDLCLAALAAGEQALRAGVLGAEVAMAVNRVLTDASEAYLLPHHTGHGLGLEHPEAPVLGRNSNEALLPNDVVTIEPGVYVPNVAGIRIEHNYVITPEGCRRLSRHFIGLTPS